jgi:hypothetical protein
MWVGGQRQASISIPGKDTRCTFNRKPGGENLFPTGIRSSDRPARSKSLYRLRYPGPRNTPYFQKKIPQYFGFIPFGRRLYFTSRVHKFLAQQERYIYNTGSCIGSTVSLSLLKMIPVKMIDIGLYHPHFQTSSHPQQLTSI